MKKMKYFFILEEIKGEKHQGYVIIDHKASKFVSVS